jgi:hypothetical protein
MNLRNLAAMTVLALFFPVLAGMSAPALWVGRAFGVPGSTATAAIAFMTDTNVPQLQFDLLFETNFLSSGTPTAGPALTDQIILSSQPSPGVRRVQLFSLSNSPMTNGVLVTLPFTIPINAPERYTGLVLTNVTLTNTLHQSIPLVTWTNGTLEILIPPAFTAVQRVTDSSVTLRVASPPSHTCIIQATTNVTQGSWLPVYTNRAPVGTFSFVDSAAAKFPHRFYRAVVVP